MSDTLISLTPPLYAEGFYELRTPYSNYLKTDHIYRCIAQRSYQEIADRGLDVLELAYTPYGLDEVDYKADLAVNATIIVLKDITDATASDYYIPDTYIVSYPNMDVSNYSRIITSLDLGALPSTIELGYLITVMQQAAQDVIGVKNSTVNIHKGAVTGTISMSEHNTLLAERLANKVLNPTLQSQLDDALEEVRELKEINKYLVATIEAMKE